MLCPLPASLALVLALAGCSERPLEEERESRRHLAAQWCEEHCTFWYECAPFLQGRPVSECRESCEADEAWDWTDECGDIKWGYRECVSDQTCEAMLDDPEIPGADNPCQWYYDEFSRVGCSYVERDGK